jgi:translation initiation factor eIF-2B subunit epsilon
LPLVKTIVSQELRSVGDALRDLDAKQLIQSDFILISGNVISNLNLASILDAHRERKTTDKNSIMTLVLKKAGLNHPTRFIII